jgi:hypothetical protein
VRVAKLVAIGVVALALPTACGSSGSTGSSGQATTSGNGHHSLSQVENVFAAQGISLHKQLPEPPAPPGSGAVWLTPAGGGPPLVGVFNSAKYTRNSNGLLPGHGHVVRNGNVVVICQGPCPQNVTLSLEQLH